MAKLGTYANLPIKNEIYDEFTTSNIKDFDTHTNKDKLEAFIANKALVEKDSNEIPKISITTNSNKEHPISTILSAIFVNDFQIHRGNRRQSRSNICYLNQFQLLNLAEFLNDTTAYEHIGSKVNNYVFRQPFINDPIRSAVGKNGTQDLNKTGYIKNSSYMDNFKSFPLNDYVYYEDSILNNNHGHNTLLQKLVNAIGISTLDVLSFQNVLHNNVKYNNNSGSNALYDLFIKATIDLSKISHTNTGDDIDVTIIGDNEVSNLVIPPDKKGKLLFKVRAKYLGVINGKFALLNEPYIWYPKTTDNRHAIIFRENGNLTTTNKIIVNKFNSSGFYVYGDHDGIGFPHVFPKSDVAGQDNSLEINYSFISKNNSFVINNNKLEFKGIQNIRYKINSTSQLTSNTAASGTTNFISSTLRNNNEYQKYDNTSNATNKYINSQVDIEGNESLIYIPKDVATQAIYNILINLVFLKEYVNTLESLDDGTDVYKVIHYNTTMQVLNFFMSNMLNIFGPTKTPYIQLFGLQMVTLYEKMQLEGEQLKDAINVANFKVIPTKINNQNIEAVDKTVIGNQTVNASSINELVMKLKDNDITLNKYKHSLSLQQNKVAEFEKQKRKMRNFFIGMVTLLILYVCVFVYSMMFNIPFVNNAQKPLILILISGIICISILGYELRLMMIDAQLIEGFTSFSISNNYVISINSLYNIMGVKDEYEFDESLEKLQLQQCKFKIFKFYIDSNNVSVVNSTYTNNNKSILLIISKFYNEIYGKYGEGKFKQGGVPTTDSYIQLNDTDENILRHGFHDGTDNMGISYIDNSFYTINNSNGSLYYPYKVYFDNTKLIPFTGKTHTLDDNMELKYPVSNVKIENNMLQFIDSKNAITFDRGDFKATPPMFYIQDNVKNFITFYKSINGVLRNKEDVDLNYLNKNKVQQINNVYNLNSMSEYNYRLMDFSYNQYIYLNVYLKLLTIAFSIIFIFMNLAGNGYLMSENLSISIIVILLIVVFIMVILHKTTEIRKKQFMYNQYRYTRK